MRTGSLVIRFSLTSIRRDLFPNRKGVLNRTPPRLADFGLAEEAEGGSAKEAKYGHGGDEAKQSKKAKTETWSDVVKGLKIKENWRQQIQTKAKTNWKQPIRFKCSIRSH